MRTPGHLPRKSDKERLEDDKDFCLDTDEEMRQDNYRKPLTTMVDMGSSRALELSVHCLGALTLLELASYGVTRRQLCHDAVQAQSQLVSASPAANG